MKHILILTFLLPMICLGQKDSITLCTGSIGFSLPPTLIGYHLPNCVHRQYCERLAKAIWAPTKNYDTAHCSHIWVREYEQNLLDELTYKARIVCIKCYKRETRDKPLPPDWLPAQGIGDGTKEHPYAY